MPSTEGNFKKTDGDDLYASEVNGFHEGTKQSVASGINSMMNINTIGDLTGEQPAAYLPGMTLIISNEDTNIPLTTTGFSVPTGMSKMVADSAGAYVYESRNIPVPATVNNVWANLEYWIEKKIGLTFSGEKWTSDDLSGEEIIKFRATSTYKLLAPAAAQNIIRFTDGTNTFEVFNVDLTSSSDFTYWSGDGIVSLDWANKVAIVTIKLEVFSEAGGIKNKTPYYLTKYVDLAGWSSFKVETQFNASSHSGTISLDYVGSLKSVNSTSSSLQISADGGSNYSLMNNGGVSVIGVTGTNVRVKLSGTVASGERVWVGGLALTPYSYA